MVFIARTPAAEADFAQLRDAVTELERRAGLGVPASESGALTAEA